MNRLTKSSSRRVGGGRGIRSPSDRGPATPVPAASPSARAGVVVSTPPVSASPFDGWWATTSPSQGLYPPGGFSNFLQSNPFANHANGNENFHFVGAGMSQSSVSLIDLGTTRTPSPAHQNDGVVDATRTPSPSQQTDGVVHGLDAEEDTTPSL